MDALNASYLPKPGTYSRVLRRYDRDARYAGQMRFNSYDVNIKAVAASLDGVVAPTLFFPPGKEAAAKRATRLGWKDETEAWQEFIEPGYAENVQATIEGLKSELDAMTWGELTNNARDLGVHTFGRKRVVITGLMMTALLAKAGIDYTASEA